MLSKSEVIFENESFKYFKRGYSMSEYLNVPPFNDFTDIIDTIIRPVRFKVLEVGCGSGKNLRYLYKNYNSECYGIEPNKDLVNKLNRDHQKNGFNIQFSSGFSNNLVFADNFFDLVICWSVLHWVDRNQFLQTLGEIFRVTNKYILLTDFCPYYPYKTLYKHKDGIYTYKIDYADIFEKTGVLKKLDELYYVPLNSIKTEKDYIILESNEYQSSKYDWLVRKRVLFEKNIDLLSLKEENDFQIQFEDKNN